MKIAAIQMQSGLDPEENLRALEPMLAEAAAAGAHYALTPEVTMIFPENREQLRSVAAPFEGHPQLARVGEVARQHGMHVHIGSLPVPLADGRFANRSVLFGPNGAIIATYDKIHLFDADIAGLNAYRESATYAGGEQAVTAALGEFTLGMSICYDMRFPRLYNALANAGASLISVPAAFTVPTGQAHWHVLLRARAIETGSYVIAAAQGGRHAEVFGGASARVAPMIQVRDGGALLQRAGLALPVADVETHVVRYSSPFALMSEIKALGASNPLVDRSRRLATPALLAAAAQAYLARDSDPDGRIRATLEVVWLSGWVPHQSQQQPLKPGSATSRLGDVLGKMP